MPRLTKLVLGLVTTVLCGSLFAANVTAQGTQTARVGRKIDTQPINPLSRGDLAAAVTHDELIPLLRGARGVSDRDSIEQLVITAKFVNANPNPEVFAEGQLSTPPARVGLLYPQIPCRTMPIPIHWLS
jgi:hypothetical protein